MKDPVTMRRQLRGELRRFRTEEKLTQRDVAKALDWSPSKVIRIENGNVAVGVTDLRALLQLYKVEDDEAVERLAEMARGSKRQPFNAYREWFAPESLRYFGYESSASRIRQVEPLLVPGLLQTEEYARALLESWGTERRTIDTVWAARAERQELFEREDPPACDFVIDEAVVRRLVGGPSVLRRQLDHLVTMSGRDEIDIKVIPFTAGGHLAQRGPFVLLEFPDPEDEDVLFLESAQGDSVFREDTDTTGRHLEIFSTLEAMADTVDIAEFLAAA